MTDEELLGLNQEGFIPGPHESERDFLDRVASFGRDMVKLSGEKVPEAHWQWVREHLREVFDFEPDSLPAFYSNRLLAPWQGAATWTLDGRLMGIQLREQMRRGSFLWGLYQRSEILAHEAVHAARSAFRENKNEEFFAYLTSESKWRRALGPVVRRPWEVWPFLVGMLVGVFWPGGWWGAAFWLMLGCGRLVRQHRILARATQHLLREVEDPRIARAILVRLTDREIHHFARIGNIREYAEQETSLRWRLIKRAYLHGKKDSSARK